MRLEDHRISLYNTGVRQHCVLDGDPGEGQSGPSQSLSMTQARADFQDTEIWCKCWLDAGGLGFHRKLVQRQGDRTLRERMDTWLLGEEEGFGCQGSPSIRFARSVFLKLSFSTRFFFLFFYLCIFLCVSQRTKMSSPLKTGEDRREDSGFWSEILKSENSAVYDHRPLQDKQPLRWHTFGGLPPVLGYRTLHSVKRAVDKCSLVCRSISGCMDRRTNESLGCGQEWESDFPCPAQKGHGHPT